MFLSFGKFWSFKQPAALLLKIIILWLRLFGYERVYLPLGKVRGKFTPTYPRGRFIFINYCPEQHTIRRIHDLALLLERRQHRCSALKPRPVPSGLLWPTNINVLRLAWQDDEFYLLQKHTPTTASKIGNRPLNEWLMLVGQEGHKYVNIGVMGHFILSSSAQFVCCITYTSSQRVDNWTE